VRIGGKKGLMLTHEVILACRYFAPHWHDHGKEPNTICSCYMLSWEGTT